MLTFSTANIWLIRLAHMSAKGAGMRSKNTQAANPSGRECVSDADVGVTGTAGASELTTTLQMPIIEQVPAKEDNSSLSTTEHDQPADRLDQLTAEIKNADPQDHSAFR